MTEELKIRVETPEKTLRRLKELGAELEKELAVKDTYFGGQGQDALKLTETEEGEFLRRYENSESGFEQVRDERVENPVEKKSELEEKYGVEAVLEKKMSYFSLGDKTIIFNRIEDLGLFLVIQADDLEKKFIEEELGADNPEYIEVPFSQLD